MQATPLFTVPCYNLLTISQLAAIIRKDWSAQKGGVHNTARPYLSEMFGIDNIGQMVGADSGRSVVSYFLCNAGQWRGEVARAVKKELNKRTK